MRSLISVAVAIVAVPVGAEDVAPSARVASMSYGQSACYGSCIAYDITVFADGRTVFESDSDATAEEIVTDEDISDPVVTGRHEYRISPQRAEGLLVKYRAADLFTLKDSYDSGIADAQSYRIGFSDNGRSKSIRDNGGERVGMPQILNDLMRETIVVSQANAMSRGAPGLVELLETAGYDFHSLDAGKMFVRAIARQADSVTINGLLNKGVPLHETWDGKSIAAWAIHAAVTFDDLATLRLLSNKGEIGRLSADDRNEIAVSANLCSLGKVRALKELGFNPVSAEKAGRFALLKTVGSCSMQDDSDKISELFRYYLAEGADPNVANKSGETALFEVSDAAAVDILIKHGADVNRLNKEGQSAVFSTWNEEAIVKLMEAGSKPVGDYFGKNFWDYAVSKNWAKVINWLDAHPDMKAIAQGN